MSAPKRGNGHFSLDAYKADAKKKGDKLGPYVLDVTPEKSITIPRPNANQMFEAEAAMQAGDSKGLIGAICGDLTEELLDLFGDEDFKVLNAFGDDLQKHFEIGV